MKVFTISNEETFLQYFLEEIFPRYYMHSTSVFSAAQVDAFSSLEWILSSLLVDWSN